jgi:hypothetical protein
MQIVPMAHPAKVKPEERPVFEIGEPGGDVSNLQACPFFAPPLQGQKLCHDGRVAFQSRNRLPILAHHPPREAVATTIHLQDTSQPFLKGRIQKSRPPTSPALVIFWRS